MSVWWEGLDTIQRVLYCIAIPSLFATVVQLFLVFLGFGDGADVNVSDTSALDFDVDMGADVDFNAADIDLSAVDSPVTPDYGGLKLFTIQGMVVFLTVFSWVAITFLAFGLPTAGAVIIGIGAGFAAMYGAAALIRFMRTLAHSGTVNYRNAIGENAEVYVPIPANGEGTGKITLNIQGRFMELNAVTNGTMLKTGANVRVTDLQGDTVVVEPIGV